MLIETLKQLSGIPGVSGNEEQVRYEILKLIEGHCIYRVDALGNILAFKKGANEPKNKLLFSAHMDEVGLIVTYVEEDGLLRFETVGGINRRTLVGRAVRIGKSGIAGVIGTKAVHLKSADEKDKTPEVKNLTIDIGAKDHADAMAHVMPGDRAVFHAAGFAPLGDRLLRGRALDDRAGCALLIEMIRSDLVYDTHFAFTVQEETGCTGARTAAAQIAPDFAVAVETTTACDIPDTPSHQVVCALDKGPVLSFMDKGTIYDTCFYRVARSLADREGIAVQSKEGVFGGNEARSIQTAGAGARVLAVSLPCRYLHTPSCVLSRFDLEQTRLLLSSLVSEIGGMDR